MKKGYKWLILFLLWWAYFLNQADRQLFSIVLPQIKAELQLTDTQLGLIASILTWTFGLLVPVAGFIGDKVSRKKMIGFSLLFWSLATILTGFCSTLLQFIFLRGVATGGGEAFYAPAANSLISDEHQKNKSLGLAIHQTAVYCGIILSGLIAGYIAETYGWRSAFYLFGIFGVLISVIIFFYFKNDIPVRATQPLSVFSVGKVLIKKSTFILLTLAFGCMVFVNIGYLTWMPSLMVEKFHLSLSQAGFSALFYHHAGAFLGVIFGGQLADRFAKTKPIYRLLVQSVALFAGAPFIYWVGMSDTLTISCLALFLFGIFRGIYDANIYASIYEVVSPSMKSSATGIMIMFAFIAGAFSPLLLGVLKPTLGLSVGISSLWVSYFLGGVFIMIAIVRFFRKDRIVHTEFNTVIEK
ncbi:MFS transporter [Pedobacter agri]|uniref:MFS transporter n=1 Tax=Pedobacter agri TaxID=454586 RepID=UPI00292D453E|nr:MFS transporter [Pedobacter agri]